MTWREHYSPMIAKIINDETAAGKTVKQNNNPKPPGMWRLIPIK